MENYQKLEKVGEGEFSDAASPRWARSPHAATGLSHPCLRSLD